MGGKQKSKNAQRTKGNVRPSSSAQAALLLESSANTPFVGFGNMPDLGYVPAAGSSGQDEAYSGVDADFRIVLRKLSKKDATTKIKALQELTELFKERDEEAIVTVLPFFPRIYNRMSIDNDRRVREATQVTFGQLLLRVGKKIAPHLKAVLGSWLVAQCDLHAPAASAAKAAFVTAFPLSSKQADAIVFCKQEILNHIEHHLIVQTAESLNSSGSNEKEDINSKYDRCMAGNLSALKLFLTSIPISQHASVKEGCKSILDQKRFWKHAKSKSNIVVSAFYSVVNALCLTVPSLARAYTKNIAPAVLHNLDEDDPTVTPALWQSVLFVVSVLEDCWQYVNVEKAFLPKLWMLFKSGGNGLAHVIYPNVLPLLSKVPEDMKGNPLHFYQVFFEKMREGLLAKKVKSSPSEVSAILHSFFECARFVIDQNVKNATGNQSLVEYVLVDQVLLLMESSIVEVDSALPTSILDTLFTELLAILYDLSLKCPSQDKTAFDTIWKPFADNFTIHLESGNKRELARISAVLICLIEGNATPVARQKKAAGVKFVDSESEINVKTEAKLSPKMAAFVSSESLQNLVSNIACKTFKLTLTYDHSAVEYMHLLSKLLSVNLSEQLMAAIVKETCPDMDIGKSVALSFVDSVVYEPMVHWPGKDDRLDLVIADFAVIFNAAFGVSQSDMQVEMLENLIQRPLSAVLMHRVLVRLKDDLHGGGSGDGLATWLHADTFGAWITRTVSFLCEQTVTGDVWASSADKEAHWGLLKFALSSSTVDQEPMIGMKHVESVLHSVRSTLQSSALVYSLPSALPFVCDVAQTFFSNFTGHLVLKAAEDLIFDLFEICCRDDIKLDEDLLKRMAVTWASGARAFTTPSGGFIPEGADGFFTKAVLLVSEQVQEARTVQRLEKLCEMAVKLGESACCEPPGANDVSGDASSEDDQRVDAISNPTVKRLFEEQLLQPNSCMVIPPSWEAGLAIQQKLFFSDLPNSDVATPIVDPASIPASVAPTVFSSLLLTALDKPARIEAFNQLFGDVAYAVAAGNAMLSVVTKPEVSHDSEVYKMTKVLKSNLHKLVYSLEVAEQFLVVKEIFSKSRKYSKLWSVALSEVLGECGKDISSHLSELVESTNGGGSVLSAGRVNTTAALLPFLTAQGAYYLFGSQALMVKSLPVQKDQCGSLRGHLYLLVQSVRLLPNTAVYADTARILMATVRAWRDELEDVFIFDTPVGEMSWELVDFNVQVMRLIRTLVDLVLSKDITAACDSTWDFILCSLAAWIQSVGESARRLRDNLRVQTFTAAACQLLTRIHRCLAPDNPTPLGYDDATPAMWASKRAEWADFFCPTIYEAVLPLFCLRVPYTSSRVLPLLIVRCVSEAAACAPRSSLEQQDCLPLRLVAEDETSAGEPRLLSILNHLSNLKLTMNPDHSVQATAFTLLNRLMPSVSEADEKMMSSQQQNDEGSEVAKEEISRPLPRCLLHVLDAAQDALLAALRDSVEFGDSATAEVAPPASDLHTVATAFLHAWLATLTLIKSAKPQLCAAYAASIASARRVDALMEVLFRLLPQNPGAPGGGASWFPPANDESDNRACGDASTSLPRLACRVYWTLLRGLPVAVRTWWNAQDKRTAAIVEKYTSKHVSPLLVQEEMTNIERNEEKIENLTIRTLPGAREVIATYLIDEITNQKMELSVSLGACHPLAAIAVDSPQQQAASSSASSQQNRRGLLQLMAFLNHQNGSILDGIRRWAENLSARFAGVEECMICYSVVHGANSSLPRMTCKACRKKFHNDCLCKWFVVSKKSSCPHCRNLF